MQAKPSIERIVRFLRRFSAPLLGFLFLFFLCKKMEVPIQWR